MYVLVAFFISCQQPGGNTTGSEFMPDMAHSVAYEANYYSYYYYNRWGGQGEYYEYAKPRRAVKGTIARGYAGEAHSDSDGVHYTANGSVPYYYQDTEEERIRAISEIIQNPYPITDAGLARAKPLYDIYCGICHGEKGDGAGFIVREDGGKYPVQPANLLLEDFVNSSNGRYYHAIMYGLNKMGAYKDKLSYKERWEVIHYIRSLQAKELKLEYNQMINTLNTIDVPAGSKPIMADLEATHDTSGAHETDHEAESKNEHH